MEFPSAKPSVPQWRESQIYRTELMPNPSVNRTLCGGPSLGYISFSPKLGPPQSAGYLER
jgi:hypothetical protein